MQTPTLHDWEQRGAVITPDEVYRFALQRCFVRDLLATDAHPCHLVYCMLNPSTANGDEDDPTIRKCCGFARILGYSGICVVNLYGYRATKPTDLRAVIADKRMMAIGTANDAWIESAFRYAFLKGRPVVAAWGKIKKTEYERALEVQAIADRVGVELVSLGTNGDGTPCHPLMLAYSTPLTPWRA